MSDWTLETDDGGISLGGHHYRVIDYRQMNTSLFEYLDKLDRQAGLGQMLAATPDGEDGEALRVCLRTAVIDAGLTCELVAGYLLPDGVPEADWTPAIAEEVRLQLSRCTAVDDVLAIQQYATEGIYGFFLRWLELNGTSQRYFSQELDRLKAAATAAH